MALKLEAHFKKQKDENLKASAEATNSKKRGETGSANLPYPKGKATDLAGKIAGVSGRQISSAKKVEARGIQPLKDMVLEGKAPASSAAQKPSRPAPYCGAARQLKPGI